MYVFFSDWILITPRYLESWMELVACFGGRSMKIWFRFSSRIFFCLFVVSNKIFSPVKYTRTHTHSIASAFFHVLFIVYTHTHTQKKWLLFCGSKHKQKHTNQILILLLLKKNSKTWRNLMNELIYGTTVCYMQEKNSFTFHKKKRELWIFNSIHRHTHCSKRLWMFLIFFSLLFFNRFNSSFSIIVIIINIDYPRFCSFSFFFLQRKWRRPVNRNEGEKSMTFNVVCYSKWCNSIYQNKKKIINKFNNNKQTFERHTRQTTQKD